ncbi:YgjV family protein [Phytobacter sp. V91]|uniref:YgjV family protein n=1 Tax=Phytobacter sp. V91 TaxID=3369425 RepID=UPI003F5DF841
MNLFLLSQLLACGAFMLDVLAFQFSRRVVSLTFLACSTSLLAFHFWLLDETSASGMMILAACRYLTATITTRSTLKWSFLGASVLCSLMTWQHPADALPLAGSLMMTLAAFQPDAGRLRILTLGGSLFWLSNNLLAGSPVAVVMEATFMMSTLISYRRLKQAKGMG